jgi:hypothetical protein
VCLGEKEAKVFLSDVVLGLLGDIFGVLKSQYTGPDVRTSFLVEELIVLLCNLKGSSVACPFAHRDVG